MVTKIELELYLFLNNNVDEMNGSALRDVEEFLFVQSKKVVSL